MESHGLAFRELECLVEGGDVNHAANHAGEAFPGGVEVDVLVGRADMVVTAGVVLNRVDEVDGGFGHEILLRAFH